MKNTDLYLNEYPIEELEKYIGQLSIKTLLYTQTLTLEFCKKYLLDGKGEEDFTVKEILSAQPHLKDLWN
jgi:hypothetical protein